MTGQTSYEEHLIGVRKGLTPEAHGDEIAWSDSKIAFVVDQCRGKDVLDLGCVQHDARFEANKFWLHKAVRSVAKSVVGLDLHGPGVEQLRMKGYDIVHGDAQDFDFGRTFEVIVAGDLIEHLSDLGGFMRSCAKHMTTESVFVVCTPNPWHWHKVVRAAWKPVPVNEEHTCWICPTTLNQLAGRYGLVVDRVEYGSMRWKDSFLPLPVRLRHSSWFSTLRLA